jgi:hypothetical protein
MVKSLQANADVLSVHGTNLVKQRSFKKSGPTHPRQLITGCEVGVAPAASE